MIKLDEEKLLQIHRQVDTPALMVDEAQMDRNIRLMQELADKTGTHLRPHTKTHKSVYIAKKQLKAGAKGITVAKLGEAKIMAQAGLNDIFIANQITHPKKLRQLKTIYQTADIAIAVDHPAQLNLLSSYFTDAKYPLSVLIEIDSGLQRCGVQVDNNLTSLAQLIKENKGLYLKGIFTHAGHVYAADNTLKVKSIAEYEAEIMDRARQLLGKAGHKLDTISVGSTPTVPISGQHEAITEIRPGNYVFFDAIQCSLGSCRDSQWALAILATVISQPAEDRLIIDAGSKALGLDQGAHGKSLVEGYGKILNFTGRISRLSEEHGIIMLEQDKKMTIGAPVLIIPNHACAVANLFNHYHFITRSGQIKKIVIDARAVSQ